MKSYTLLISLVLLSIGCSGIPSGEKELENITQLALPQEELPGGWEREGVFVKRYYQLFNPATGKTFFKEKSPNLTQLHLIVRSDSQVLFDGWIHKPVCEGWISMPYAPPLVPCKRGLSLEINRTPLKSLSIAQVSEGFLYISASYSDGTSNPYIDCEEVSWRKLSKPIQKTDEKGITYSFIDSRKAPLNIEKRQFLPEFLSIKI